MDDLHALVLAVLEHHDGYCLDNADERELLATALTKFLNAELYLVVTAEGGLLTGATIWRTQESAEHAARDFLAAADLDSDDVAVLRLGYGSAEVVITSKMLLADADQ